MVKKDGEKKPWEVVHPEILVVLKTLISMVLQTLRDQFFGD